MRVFLRSSYIVIAIQVLHVVESSKRPLWNVAHMVNSRDQVDRYLKRGANAIEFDITFDSSGNAVSTYHGTPCDCWRKCWRTENFTDYLEYMRQLTSPGDKLFREELVLLMLDLKLSKLSNSLQYKAGTDVSRKIVDVYWLKGKSNARAYLLFSIPSITQKSFIEGFRSYLKSEGFNDYEQKIGYDFSTNENLEDIRRTWVSLGISSNIWQGDGVTNCLKRYARRLKEVLKKRDQSGVTYVDKVYWWTVDRKLTMRKVLRLDVDGMITNHPDRFVNVLEEPEFSSRFRMATINDNPWSKITEKPWGIPNNDDAITGRRRKETEEEEEEDELLENS